MSPSAVLWDIDGTLLTAERVAVDAFLDAVADVAGRRPVGRGLDLGGRMDPEIAAALLGSVDADEQLAPEVLSQLRLITAARAAEFAARVRPLPGVLAMVSDLAAAGVSQTVVTGNIESVGRLKLESAQLIPPIRPELGGYGDSGPNRVEVARGALAGLAAIGWTGSPDDCWIIGDTPRDLWCARAVGVRCALVASGRHPVSALSGLGADVVLAGLDEPDALLAVWNLVPGRAGG